MYEYIALCQLRAFGVFILYYDRLYLVYLAREEFNNRQYEYFAGRLNNSNSNVTESINVRFGIFMFIRTGLVIRMIRIDRIMVCSKLFGFLNRLNS